MKRWKKTALIATGILFVIFTNLVSARVGWVFGDENRQNAITRERKQQDAYREKQLQEEAKVYPLSPDGLLKAVNEKRDYNGLSLLKLNDNLNRSAAMKCIDMHNENYYDHVNPRTGMDGYEYITQETGLEYNIGEVLNRNKDKSGKQIVDGWMDSRPHRLGLLKPNMTDIGFSTCIVEGKLAAVGHIAEIR